MHSSALVNSWHPVGNVNQAEFTEARTQIHWACQVIGAAGAAWCPPQDDQSHTNMTWDIAAGHMRGRLIHGTLRFRFAVTFPDLTLRCVGDDGVELRSLPMAGKTIDDVFAWSEQAAVATAGSDGKLQKPNYDMPAHAVATGGAFSLSPAANTEVANWYNNAELVLEEIRATNPEASEVACWPHHFDIATLIVLDPSEPDTEKARSIGAGMTPGDGGTPEPYWYVTPWPYPETHNLPALKGNGHWNTEGWVGATLPASSVTTVAKDKQAQQTWDFLESAVSACRELLHG